MKIQHLNSAEDIYDLMDTFINICGTDLVSYYSPARNVIHTVYRYSPSEARAEKYGWIELPYREWYHRHVPLERIFEEWERYERIRVNWETVTEESRI